MHFSVRLLPCLVFGAVAHPANPTTPTTTTTICTPNSPAYCDGLPPSPNPDDPYPYLCNDPRLGPETLHTSFPFSMLFAGYLRTGTLCAAPFLTKWTNKTNPTYYLNPAGSGFAFSATNTTINRTMWLPRGMKLDRFGAETGRFLAPFGTPVVERGLYPSSLNHAGNWTHNYRVYEVVGGFYADVGVIAGWVEQPGMGTQVVLPEGVSVGGLVDGGVLRRVDEWEYERAGWVVPTQPGDGRPGAWIPGEDGVGGDFIEGRDVERG